MLGHTHLLRADALVLVQPSGNRWQEPLRPTPRARPWEDGARGMHHRVVTNKANAGRDGWNWITASPRGDGRSVGWGCTENSAVVHWNLCS